MCNYIITGIIIFILMIIFSKQIVKVDYVINEYEERVIQHKIESKMYPLEYFSCFLIFAFGWPIVFPILIIRYIYVLFDGVKCKLNDEYKNYIYEFKNKKANLIIERIYNFFNKKI